MEWDASCRRSQTYPSEVSDEGWSLADPYLTLVQQAAPQRVFPRRDLFNVLRYVILYGIAWRAMPNDSPHWAAVYQQMQRWMTAACFEALAQDLRALLRLTTGRKEEPTPALIDSRTLCSTSESGPCAGYDDAKRKRGSKVHLAVDTLGHLLALRVTPAKIGNRAAAAHLEADAQDHKRHAHPGFYRPEFSPRRCRRGCAGRRNDPVRVYVVKLPEAKRGVVLLTRAGSWKDRLPSRWRSAGALVTFV